MFFYIVSGDTGSHFAAEQPQMFIQHVSPFLCGPLILPRRQQSHPHCEPTFLGIYSCCGIACFQRLNQFSRYRKMSGSTNRQVVLRLPFHKKVQGRLQNLWDSEEAF
jgi:hypothetical protein